MLGAMVLAAVAYSLTLLPGLDLGDTASFQTIVTFPLLVPRHAYPLYFALGKMAVFVSGADPGRALNVLSACAGTAAAGAFAWCAWHLTGSRLAAFWSALLFAFGYTAWSQSVIAEVYSLEALFSAAVMGAALRWWNTPTWGRLAWLHAVYALSFGNHLSMILLAPALAWVLWRGRARASIDPFSSRGLALAAAFAAVGALQYGWNLYGLWVLSGPRPPAGELLATFWFDVTKADWRESLVGAVPPGQWPERFAMYWWDLQQQYGLAGIAVAALGAAALARTSTTWMTALSLAWLVTFAFAFLYNVGDTHAFLLPSHQIVAMFAGAGAATIVRASRALRPAARRAVLLLFCAIPVWRGIETWPAVDRSTDRRPTALAAAAVRGLDSRSVYVGDLNWQIQNAVEQYVATHQPELPRVYSSSVLWHFPEFVRRNQALGRDVVLTPPAASTIRAVYGARFPLELDPSGVTSTLGDVPLPPLGTPYVLTVLSPLSGVSFDRARVERIARALSGEALPSGPYVAIAGVAGSRPVLRVGAARPFHVTARLPFGQLLVRMDAWLRFDTMRRAGFGHVIARRRHALTVERGATLGIFDANGRIAAHAYEGGSFSLDGRYRIPVLR